MYFYIFANSLLGLLINRLIVRFRAAKIGSSFSLNEFDIALYC